MNAENIAEIFRQENIDTSITCPQAFAIAKKHRIAKKDISEFCNSHGIKIRACQLGCFK